MGLNKKQIDQSKVCIKLLDLCNPTCEIVQYKWNTGEGN